MASTRILMVRPRPASVLEDTSAQPRNWRPLCRVATCGVTPLVLKLVQTRTSSVTANLVHLDLLVQEVSLVGQENGWQGAAVRQPHLGWQCKKSVIHHIFSPMCFGRLGDTISCPHLPIHRLKHKVEFFDPSEHHPFLKRCVLFWIPSVTALFPCFHGILVVTGMS